MKRSFFLLTPIARVISYLVVATIMNPQNQPKWALLGSGK